MYLSTGDFCHIDPIRDIVVDEIPRHAAVLLCLMPAFFKECRLILVRKVRVSEIRLKVDGQILTPNLCSHHFHYAAEKIGLTGMRLHDLRHTVVTYMLDAGENPRTVQEFVGHADPGFMLRQYAHVLEKSKKQASDALMRNLFRQNV